MFSAGQKCFFEIGKCLINFLEHEVISWLEGAENQVPLQDGTPFFGMRISKTPLLQRRGPIGPNMGTHDLRIC